MPIHQSAAVCHLNRQSLLPIRDAPQLQPSSIVIHARHKMPSRIQYTCCHCHGHDASIPVADTCCRPSLGAIAPLSQS